MSFQHGSWKIFLLNITDPHYCRRYAFIFGIVAKVFHYDHIEILILAIVIVTIVWLYRLCYEGEIEHQSTIEHKSTLLSR